MPDAQEYGDPNEVATLVPAAGEGSRLGGPRKQFRMLGDRPLLVEVLLVFERHPGVGHVVVAVPEEHVQEVSDRLRAEGLSKLTAVVSGGESRQSSVRHALRAVPAPVEVVLVHDAVRPFVRGREVQAVIDSTREHGAAALALPVTDTLREGSADLFGETVPRDGLYQMQTPQGFRRAWLEEAHRAATQSDESVATDDVGLVQGQGRDVHRVPGSRQNFKITTPSDWRLAQQLWGSWTNDPDRFVSSS